jgi:hypothetical protein
VVTTPTKPVVTDPIPADLKQVMRHRVCLIVSPTAVGGSSYALVGAAEVGPQHGGRLSPVSVSPLRARLAATGSSVLASQRCPSRPPRNESKIAKPCPTNPVATSLSPLAPLRTVRLAPANPLRGLLDDLGQLIDQHPVMANAAGPSR